MIISNKSLLSVCFQSVLGNTRREANHDFVSVEVPFLNARENLTETPGKTSFLSQAVAVTKEGGCGKCINDNVSEKVTCKPVDKTVVGQATILFLKQICNSDTSRISISRLCPRPYSPGSTSSLPQPITLTTENAPEKEEVLQTPVPWVTYNMSHHRTSVYHLGWEERQKPNWGGDWDQ